MFQFEARFCYLFSSAADLSLNRGFFFLSRVSRRTLFVHRATRVVRLWPVSISLSLRLGAYKECTAVRRACMYVCMAGGKQEGRWKVVQPVAPLLGRERTVG